MRNFFKDKDEAGWEEYLRWSDKYAARCFELIQRFQDMPDCDELLNRKLDEEFGGLEIFESVPSWDYAEEMDRYAAEDSDVEDAQDDADGGALEGAEWTETPASRRALDQIVFNAQKLAQGISQIASNWSNMIAIFYIDNPEENAEQFRFLFYVSRSLSYLNLAMEGLMAQPSLSVVAAYKRSLSDLNAAVGVIDKLKLSFEKTNPPLAVSVVTQKKHVIIVAEGVSATILAIRSLIANYGQEG